MRTMGLLEDLEFDAKRAHAVPLFVDKAGRILSFTLRPGQSLKEHTAPSSPLYLVILKGRGMFAGGDGKESELGPNSLVVLEQGEAHSVRALEQDLVFVGFMHGERTARKDKVAGKMAGQ